jgi:hypothetical protein
MQPCEVASTTFHVRVHAQAMLKDALLADGSIHLEQLSAALDTAAKDLQVTTIEDVEALNGILGQVLPQPPNFCMCHYVPLVTHADMAVSLLAVSAAHAATANFMFRLQIWMLALQAVKLGDLSVVQRLLALLPRNIDGGIGKVRPCAMVMNAAVDMTCPPH